MKTVKGNLIDLAEAGEFDIIIQGCNCFNTMGSGLAREIRARYPGAYAADCQTTAGDREKLGTLTAYHTGQFTIINAYTQYDFSRGSDVFEYDAFANILATLLLKAKEEPETRFGFPLIGCGLAGGDKEKILTMIENFSSLVGDDKVTVVEFAL